MRGAAGFKGFAKRALGQFGNYVAVAKLRVSAVYGQGIASVQRQCFEVPIPSAPKILKAQVAAG